MRRKKKETKKKNGRRRGREEGGKRRWDRTLVRCRASRARTANPFPRMRCPGAKECRAVGCNKAMRERHLSSATQPRQAGVSLASECEK